MVTRKELVNFSVKAQDLILKGGASFRTTDDLVNGLKERVNYSTSVGPAGTNATTHITNDDHSKYMLNRSMIQDMNDQLLLPSIKTVRKQQQSPFNKGNSFFDVSQNSMKMRQTTFVDKQGGSAFKGNKFSAQEDNFGSFLKDIKINDISHSNERKLAFKMNPKVLETWINETLQDAEHLDIPGVILKPEHKNPISRYGIDRLALTNAGIPNELVDRIFRALFVYSVGFYELIKRCLQHTEKKYTIITSIWKVFSILLEYCCKTDYRMLISEISKEHKEELEKLEKEFQQKFQEQAQNEKILKQNMEILQKYNEEVEKDRTNERQMRLKLEEEYMQNTKNHEEEVQLRLKFESKLNNMHSVHRDLETKYKRALNEMAALQNTNDQVTTKNNALLEELTELKTLKAEYESKINYNEEKMAALKREINIKIKQVEDYEQRYTTTQDELDLTKYKLQESNKDITELRLKIDVFDSQISGLKNEKQHLQLELKETKELQKIYETKCTELMNEINKINVEYQDSKREIIGFGEIQKEREERIEKLKKDLREVKILYEELDIKHGTLNIQYEKVKEQYETCKKDLDDAIDKLHITNKVRHETEVKLNEEIEKNRTQHDIIKEKEEQLSKRIQEIEELDKKVIDLERVNEALEIKKAGIERQYELTKKQLNEKVANLNDVLNSEKETREMWIERYEKEQRDHTATNAQLLATRSQLKDQVLQTKNAEIKLATVTKANEIMSDSNQRLQDNLNEALAKCENLEREINTQKEIMKQMDQARKEYIQKLKRELETVESRFYKQMEGINMISEEYYTRAAKNLLDFQLCKFKLDETMDELSKCKSILKEKEDQIELDVLSIRNLEMLVEEMISRQYYLKEDNNNLSQVLKLIKQKIEQMEITNKLLKDEADLKVKFQSDYNELMKKHNQAKKELARLKNIQANKAPTPPPVEKNDQEIQTILDGSQIEQLQHQRSISQDNNLTQSYEKPKSGDSTAAPTRGQDRRNSNANRKPGSKNGQMRNQSNQRGQNSPQKGQIQQNKSNGNASQINSSMSKDQPTYQENDQETVHQQQNNQLNKGNLEIDDTPQTKQQIINQGRFPNTTTNNNFNQRNQLQYENRQSVDSQQFTSRTQGLNPQYDNYLNKGDQQSSSNMGETMITKQSPGPQSYQAHNQQYIGGSQHGGDFGDPTTIMSSLMQSPQNTLHQNMVQGRPNLQLNQTILANSQGNILPSEYQTIQSQSHQRGYEDGYQHFQYQQQFNHDQVIIEQQIEDEEERKTAYGGDRSSKGSRGQYTTVVPRGQSRDTFTGGNPNRPQQQYQVEYVGMNTVMQQQQPYNNRNTVANNQINNQISNGSNVSNGQRQMEQNSNNSLQFSNRNKIAPQYNNETQYFDSQQIHTNNQIQYAQQYQQQMPLTEQQSQMNQYNHDNNNNINYNSNQPPYHEDNEQEDKEISRQHDIDSFGQDSVQFNQYQQPIYNNTQYQKQNTQNQQNFGIQNQDINYGNIPISQGTLYQNQGFNNSQVQQQQQQQPSNRIRVDVNSGNPSDRRQQQQNQMLPPINNNNMNNGQASMQQSPLSYNSGYSNNIAQNRFGQQPMNPMNQTGNSIGNQQFNSTMNNSQLENKKVVGKTSIRTLIKSAATREQ